MIISTKNIICVKADFQLFALLYGNDVDVVLASDIYLGNRTPYPFFKAGYFKNRILRRKLDEIENVVGIVPYGKLVGKLSVRKENLIGTNLLQ